MDKVIYAVGSKVRVTKSHSLSWIQPWPEAGDVLTVKERNEMPHTWGPNLDVYITTNKEGKRVVVCEDKIEPAGDFSTGDRVFVTETHSALEGTYLKVYAGSHYTITRSDNPLFYWADDDAGDQRALLADKIALVETEPERMTPPVAPKYAAKQGHVIYHEKGTEAEGYWTYDNYWGWSNFVPAKADLWRKPDTGEDMSTNGVLATSSIDGSNVQAV